MTAFVSSMSCGSAPSSGWAGELSLQFGNSDRGTRLTRSRHNGPLYVQKPFYPEGPDHAHVYLLHPPGGVVSGDVLDIAIEVGAGAGVLATTPGAARIYRARRGIALTANGTSLQRQRIHLTVAENALMEWFPLETIVFNDAQVELETTVDLLSGSSFAAWEICCLGLPASDERFKQGSFLQRYRVNKNGLPLFVERFSIDDNNRDSMLEGRVGMQGLPVTGFFLLHGNVGVDTDAESAVELLAKLRASVSGLGLEHLAAMSKVGECYVGRYLGDNAEQARQIFTAWWQILRPALFQRKACAPRIWLT